jgi:hypothetical protein
MKTTFIRALAVTAALQFLATRVRAGNAMEEGEAEAMWLRYPFVVVANALAWTLMLSTIGGLTGPLRRAWR